MIIQKLDDVFVIKVYNALLEDFNIFDIDSVKEFFRSIVNKMKTKYDLRGIVDVDVYVNDKYGMIIEMKEISDYFDEIDMRIKMHLNSLFLTEINSNEVLDYDDVYYYKNKFYGNYIGIVDSDVIYKDSEDIINKGIKVC